METTLTYTAAQQAVSEAHDEAAKLRERHRIEARDAQAKIEKAVADLRHLKAGTSPEIRESAERVIEIRGARWVETEDGPEALREAIRDLVTGCKGLAQHTYGTKSYSRWPGQRCDNQYGYGPKHGSIRLSIGLTKEARDHLAEHGLLPESEIEAAVQLLTNLPEYVRNGGE